MTYPNKALADICEQILDEWELTTAQIANIAKDIPGECDNIIRNRADAALETRQTKETENVA